MFSANIGSSSNCIAINFVPVSAKSSNSLSSSKKNSANSAAAESVHKNLAKEIKRNIEQNKSKSIVFVDVRNDKATTAFPNRVLVTVSDVQYVYVTVGVLYRLVERSENKEVFVDEHYAIRMVTRDGNSVSGVKYRAYQCNREGKFLQSGEKYLHSEGDPVEAFFKPDFSIPTGNRKLERQYQICGAVLCLNAGQQESSFRSSIDSLKLSENEVVASVSNRSLKLAHLNLLRFPVNEPSRHLVLPIIQRFGASIPGSPHKLLPSNLSTDLCEAKYHTFDPVKNYPILQNAWKTDFQRFYHEYKESLGDNYSCIFSFPGLTDESVFHSVFHCENSWVHVSFSLKEKWIVVNDPSYNQLRSLAAASGILHFIKLEYETQNQG